MPTNRLINEKSPYLLQHAHNPVDWYPWSDEAIERARVEDKPIFLSIGYAACHWCHVMENESFEDQDVADYLNETFICIKVDREERPDVDAVYMAACQMLTGGGGWPLNIIMTPDKEPFFAATYIPKHNHLGRPGLIEICGRIKDLWTTERRRVLDSAQHLAGQLDRMFAYQNDAELDASLLDRAFRQLEELYDADWGGFGKAPKFPTTHWLLFLLRYHHRTGNVSSLDMVQKTLTAMRYGGIWDHVGYGFHRYSTDKYWLLPHFEKMLYDQAGLAQAYLEIYQLTGNSFYADTANDIFTYVLRDMTSKDGGFFSAEDADSEGEEGKFYVWTMAEIKKLLDKEEIELLVKIFRLSEEGNFHDEATRRKTGANILHLGSPPAQQAEDLGISETELENRWTQIRGRLFAAREKRVRPLKDDKILADWNGLMIASLALGARVLGRPEYEKAACAAADFVLAKMRDSSGMLRHRFRDGELAVAANANDYAFFIRGLLSLFQTNLDPRYLQEAAQLQSRMADFFWDSKKGGFFLTGADSCDLPVRPKELYDGAMPSANSVAFCNLLLLFKLTGLPHWREMADSLARAFLGTVKEQPVGYAYFLLGLDLAVTPGKEVVIVGERESPSTREMLAVVHRSFAPYTTVLLKNAANAEQLAGLAGYTGQLVLKPGVSTAYVCTDFACQAPTTDPLTLSSYLS